MAERDVVTCGECRHYLHCLISGGPEGRKDWFCADGEREEQTTMEDGHEQQ